MKRFIAILGRYYHESRGALLGLTLVSLLFLLSGCGSAISDATNSIDDVINTIDNSRSTIEKESGEWRSLLPKLIEQLKGMESNISTDAKGILADTTSQLQDLSNQASQFTDAKAQDLFAQAGVEFRCNVTFVKDGAVAQLRSIVEDLKFWKAHKQHQDKKPNHAVCWINPTVLSLYPSGNDWLIDTKNMSDPYIVRVFGYNFWSENLPALELQDATGRKIRDILVKPAYVTHYQINLNFSNERFTDPKPDARVVFRWPDQPDPNSISLVRRPPANLSITDITFNNRSPIATKDPVWPKVTIKNEGGSPSDRFVVIWQPNPGAPVKSQSVNRALAAGESVSVEFPAWTYPVCGPFTSNISLSSGGPSRNESITVAPFCPPAQTPPPSPERQFGRYLDSLQSFGPGGAGRTQDFGTTCDPGYHRSRAIVGQKTSGPGAGCYFVSWTEDNEHMCKATIRFWVDGFSGVDCTIQIYEIGDPMPTPTPPPSCSCRP